MQQLRLFEQHRTATGLVHGLGRAAKVEVDDLAAQLAGQRRVVRQTRRVRTQQLHAQGYASTGFGTVLQLRGELVDIGFGQQPFSDPNKFGHTPINTAGAGQDITQDVVDQPLHRRQSNLHG